MFISVSGFQDDGITLPEYLRPNPNPNQPENTAKQVVFCLIRWLEPHPDARLRDAEGRPVCPALSTSITACGDLPDYAGPVHVFLRIS